MFIGIQVDRELAAELDKARGRKERSQFVREAIAEKLNDMGVRVRDELIFPPPRARVVQVQHTGSGDQHNHFDKVSYLKRKRKKKK